jgi:hypothetical protein
MLNLQGVRVGLDSDEAGLSSSNGLLWTGQWTKSSKKVEFFDQLNDCQFLKKDYAPKS